MCWLALGNMAVKKIKTESSEDLAESVGHLAEEAEGKIKKSSADEAPEKQ